MTPITSRTDWSADLLQEVYGHIEDIGVNDLKLDVYPNQIEVISAEQMLDAYSSVGLPVHYNHWSFGKSFMRDWTKYQKGQMGLAYEIVINSNPCISYLMEENNAITQTLVIAHAAFGHNHVFKNNYLFKDWTSAGSIIDYMLFAKRYIQDCESRYGEDEVEKMLNAAHALASHGVDQRHRKHKKRLTVEEQAAKVLDKSNEEQKNLDIILKRMRLTEPVIDNEADEQAFDEENLIYFIYKYAPHMDSWKRELLRIIYKIQQYFYPQGQTKTLNEGFATHTHWYIMNELEARNLITPDAQLSWLQQHSGVVYQPSYNSQHYSGFNPYALGFAIFKDIRRICESPTAEDKEWFPNLIGQDWRDAQKLAAADYRDESFIEQFLSPKLIREWGLFSVAKRLNVNTSIVKDISDDIGYAALRQDLARGYNRINSTPEIVVTSADMKKDRTLTLTYKPYAGRTLFKPYREATLQHIKYLWGYNVELVG